MTAVAMKVPTATAERTDSLARPQMPWPEVHPDPIAVPRPTTNPATGSSSPVVFGTISIGRYTTLILSQDD